ncbi:hypothetical protein AYX13_06996 [Cryptococcus neoformans]|nr:hypothetical protein AYX13_06996 [Cryptococcus neoformans var. grubii]
MERLAYLQDANPGKILHHQLDGSCYQVDDQDVQHEHGCLVLTINISIDWADPSKSRNHSPRSMGPIMLLSPPKANINSLSSILSITDKTYV